MIEISKVIKKFGNRMVLDTIDLNIPENSIYGLLGANGAGKTTLIRSILNLTQIHSGSIRIGNIEHKNPKSRESISYLPEHFQFYPYYSVMQTVSFLSLQQTTQNSKEKIEEVFQLLELEKLKNIKIGLLSKGQLQRVGIAKIMLSNAQVLILDEPFSGLDPVGVKNLRTFLVEENKKGRTIFINSHLISQVEKFITNFAILKKGSIVLTGTSKDLTEKQHLEDIVIESLS